MIRRIMAACRNLLPVGLFILSVSATAGIIVVDGRLSDLGDRVQPGAEEEMRRFHVQMRIDETVEKLLADLAEDTEGDRALVYLAHNGKTDLSGAIPFLYLSASHVHLRPGLAWQERWSRPEAMSVFSPLLRRMFREPGDPRCVMRDRGDADMTEVARARMVDRGVETAMLCALHGPRGVVGLIAVEYLRRQTKRPPDAAIETALRRAAERVHTALTGG
jgi:hypothetical protein